MEADSPEAVGLAVSYAADYLGAVARLAESLDPQRIDDMAEALVRLRDRDGRLFLVGNGGGAGHASHAAADFRLKCRIDARVLTDNVSEFTARINDDGTENAVADWLEDCDFASADALFVFSVNGGTSEISTNLTKAMAYASACNGLVMGIAGIPGGDLGTYSSAIILPAVDAPKTPLVESFQAVIWHALVVHPLLCRR